MARCLAELCFNWTGHGCACEVLDLEPEDVSRGEALLCDWCYPLLKREPGRPVTAGCVHEHLTTLTLCRTHERAARTRTTWCLPCRESGSDKVPVRVLTTADDQRA